MATPLEERHLVVTIRIEHRDLVLTIRTELIRSTLDHVYGVEISGLTI